jgi:thiol-disulfide isomerase/thioredoxin
MNKIEITFAVVSFVITSVIAILFYIDTTTSNNTLYQAPNSEPTSIVKTEFKARGEMMRFEQHTSPMDIEKLNFKDIEGNDVNFSDFKGKLLLVNFWASWCGPCRMELPELAKLHAEMKSDHFQVILMSEDTKFENSTKMLRQMGLENLPSYFDKDKKLGRSYYVSALPLTLLIDENGREIGRFLGPAHWAGEDAKDLIRHFIPRK